MLVLLLAGLVGWWALKDRGPRALRFGDVAAAVAGITAFALFRKGEALPAIAALAGAGWWLWMRRRPAIGATSPAPFAAAMDLAEAGRLLGVSPTADTAEIRQAHRRLLARLHPDAGGSDALAAQVNAARDALLAARR